MKLILICSVMLMGCEVFKKRTSDIKTDTRTSTVDSGRVDTSHLRNREKENWWRETVVYPGRDTTIIVQPQYNAPVKVIREGGSRESETEIMRMMFEFLNKKDTASVIQVKTESETKRKVLTFWHLLGVGIASIGITLLLTKLKFR